MLTEVGRKENKKTEAKNREEEQESILIFDLSVIKK